MMLKNNMFSRVGKLLVAGLLVAYGNVGYAQSNVQRRADTLMTELVKAETDSLKISYADELGRLLTVLKPADYDLLRPVKYLNYKKSPLTGAEMFSWQVQLTDGAAFIMFLSSEVSGKMWCGVICPENRRRFRIICFMIGWPLKRVKNIAIYFSDGVKRLKQTVKDCGWWILQRTAR